MGSQTVGADTKNTRILIVEDEGIIARDLKQILEEVGYSVSGIVSSGEQALLLAGQEHIDLVLMDIHIKGPLDGVETAERMRKQYQLAVVYLTAHNDQFTVARANETKPFGYINKPILEDDVKTAVAAALETYRAQKAAGTGGK